MSTSLLYLGFGITCYDYRITAYHEDDKPFTILRKDCHLHFRVGISKMVINHRSSPR